MHDPTHRNSEIESIDMTDPVQAQEALRETEERFRATFEQAAVGMAHVARDGSWLRVNNRFCEITGYPREEVLKLRFQDITHPDDVARDEELTARMYAGKIPYFVMEKRYIRRDGSVIWVEITVSPLPEKGKYGDYHICVVQDLTERKLLEESLHTRNRRLDILAQLSARLMGAEAPLDAASAAYAAMRGELGLDAYFNFLVQPDGSLSLDSFDGIPAPAARLISRLEPGAAVCGWVAEAAVPCHATAIQGSCSERVTLLRHYGLRAYYCNPMIVRGRVIGTLSFGTRAKDEFSDDDREFMETVTAHVALADQRLAAERELRQSEAQFRQLAETLPQLIWISDPQGTIEYLNGRWTEYTGTTSRDPVEEMPERLLHPDDVDRTRKKWEHCLATGEPFETEYRLRREKDGRYRWFLARAIAIRGGENDIVRWFGTCTDIHDRKALESERELLLQSISHDLRTPLAATQGFIRLALEEERAASVRNELEAALDGTHRMNSMIQDLVDAARLESGQMVLNREQVELRPLLEGLIRSVTTAIDASRITIHIPPQLPPVLADRARLERIFLNLLTNALKYSAPGTPVEVHAEQREEQVLICVRDRGRGIDPDDLQHIFEKFYRVKGGRKGGGLGLGLYITRRLVEAHGGSICAESGKGSGSTFHFTLQAAPWAATAGKD